MTTVSVLALLVLVCAYLTYTAEAEPQCIKIKILNKGGYILKYKVYRKDKHDKEQCSGEPKHKKSKHLIAGTSDTFSVVKGRDIKLWPALGSSNKMEKVNEEGVWLCKGKTWSFACTFTKGDPDKTKPEGEGGEGEGEKEKEEKGGKGEQDPVEGKGNANGGGPEKEGAGGKGEEQSKHKGESGGEQKREQGGKE